ncbi:MAG TPA: ATP-binding protein [Patescibacteria group bacterium]|nr:ATP-binding protein [Patescibacteria group bacterium]
MTIRARLTLWFSLILSVVLGIFAYTEYNEAAIRRERYFNERLRLRALDAGNIFLDADQIPPAVLEKARERFRHTLDHEFIAIYDSTGKVVFRSEPHQPDFILTKESIREIFLKHTIERSIRDTQYHYEAHADTKGRFIIAARAYDTQGYAFLSNLRANLVTGYFATVAIITLICWYFAKKALQPVEAMRRKAASISASSLDQRLEVPVERDEIALLAIEFNSMFDRLEAGFRSQRQFIANASHEIRTPLAIVQSAAGVALMQPRSPEEYHSVLQTVVTTTQRLQRLADDLLYLARAESDLANLPDTTLHFDEVVYSALERIQQIYPNRVFHNITDLPEDEELLVIKGNSELLHIAIVNILDNAAKYSPHDAHVTIQLFTKEGRIHCIITDKGFGIRQDDYPLIFNLFFRAETVKKLEGNGVGLPLVKSIIERHGGTITVESKANSGTTVSIILPSIKIFKSST